MPTISLTDFVDFVISSGSPKLTIVRQLKSRGNYGPQFDFWRTLRTEIVEYHRTGQTNRGVLNAVLSGLTDPKKVSAYPDLVNSYKRFLGQKRIKWFDPPSKNWISGGLTVKANPELGLVINGARHLVKLYFKRKQSLSRRRIELILTLMDQALASQLSAKASLAVLDIPRGNLISSPAPNANLLPLLQGEAASFTTMWNGI